MTAIGVVERVFGHLERREGAELLELLAEDVAWTLPAVLPFGGRVTGRAAAGATLAAIWEHVFDWGARVDEIVDVGPFVVATGRHPVTTQEGVVVEIPFLTVWQVEDGRVARFEEHLDTLQFLRAVGRPSTG